MIYDVGIYYHVVNIKCSHDIDKRIAMESLIDNEITLEKIETRIKENKEVKEEIENFKKKIEEHHLLIRERERSGKKLAYLKSISK